MSSIDPLASHACSQACAASDQPPRRSTFKKVLEAAAGVAAAAVPIVGPAIAGAVANGRIAAATGL